MRISSRGEYGVRALFDLAQHYGEGPVQSDDVAARQGIPVNYLNQLFLQLRKAGLIDSLRGPQGGHMLARPPAEISLRDALRVMEGPLMTSDAGRDDVPASQPEDQEILGAVWAAVRAVLEQALQEITLEDLCQRKRQHDGYIMYHI